VRILDTEFVAFADCQPNSGSKKPQMLQYRHKKTGKAALSGRLSAGKQTRTKTTLYSERK